MENSANLVSPERNGETAISSSSPSGDGSKFSVHEFMGGGTTADVLLWKRRLVSFGVIFVATVAWLIVELSGLPVFSLWSDVLLLLIVVLFVRADYAAYRDKYA